MLLTSSKYDYVSVAAQLISNRFHTKVVSATEGRDEMDTFPTFYRANSRRQLGRLAALLPWPKKPARGRQPNFASVWATATDF